MREQIVQLGADLQNPSRRAFLSHILRNDLDEGFPVRGRDCCLVGNVVTVVTSVLCIEDIAIAA